LRKRGIPFDVAKAMQMGFLEKGFVSGDHEAERKWNWYNRLLIPVYEGGQLISIEGRDVTGDLNAAKVLYPKESSVNTLYEFEKLDLHKPLYAVEGLLDLAVLRTDSYFANSTSIFGAALTPRKIWLFNQFDELIYIPDNDKAGRQTLAKLKDELEKPFRVLDVPRLGDIKDIGDIPQKLHTTVFALRKKGWGRILRNSITLAGL
jgi:DNA primase